MILPRVGIALLIIAVVTGCAAPPTTPSPSALAAGEASPSAASPVPSPTPVATPSVTPVPTATPLPTPTAAPTPAPTPEPWKAYTSKRYHYSIKYPPAWVVTPGSAGVSDQFDNYDYPYAYVFRDVMASGSTGSLSLTVTADTAYYKSHYKAKLISSRPLTVAGWPARLLIFSGVNQGVKTQFQHLIVAKGRIAYFIDMDGRIGNAAGDKVLFKKFYLTFKPLP